MLQLKTVDRIWELAADEAQHHAMATVFRELAVQKKELQADIKSVASRDSVHSAPTRTAVDGVIQAMDQLPELIAKSEDFAVAKDLFDLTNLRLLLRFVRTSQGERIVNRTSGGTVTLGAAELPIATYSGPTAVANKKSGCHSRDTRR